LTVYLDTSVLVAAVTREDGTARVLALLQSLQGKGFAVSDWSFAEMAAALAGKLRLRTIDSAAHDQAKLAFVAMASEQLRTLPVERADFSAAARLVERQDFVISAPDALHLAVAARHGAAFATLDQQQAGAARVMGLRVVGIASG
jgi:predicted nucleic acid-binding protein